LVDLNGVRAFELHRIKLFVVHDEVFVLRNLIALADLVARHFFFSVGIYFFVADAVAGFFADLPEGYFPSSRWPV
jgi:hypothetical protein